MAETMVRLPEFKCVTISTRHITLVDHDILESDSYDQISVGVSSHPYGWWIWTGPDVGWNRHNKDLAEAGFSEAFIALVKMAWDQKARYINLDRDGPEMDDLEKFDW